MTVLVMKVRRFATGKNSQQGGGPSLKAIGPPPFLRGAQAQVNILLFACLFQLEGMFSTSEDVKDSLRFGKEALVCHKHSLVWGTCSQQRVIIKYLCFITTWLCLTAEQCLSSWGMLQTFQSVHPPSQASVCIHPSHVPHRMCEAPA